MVKCNTSYGGANIYDTHPSWLGRAVFHAIQYLGDPPDCELLEAEFLEDSAIHLGSWQPLDQSPAFFQFVKRRERREWGTKLTAPLASLGPLGIFKTLHEKKIPPQKKNPQKTNKPKTKPERPLYKHQVLIISRWGLLRACFHQGGRLLPTRAQPWGLKRDLWALSSLQLHLICSSQNSMRSALVFPFQRRRNRTEEVSHLPLPWKSQVLNQVRL